MDSNLTRGEHEEYRRTVEAEFTQLKAENTRQNKRIDNLEEQTKELTSLNVSIRELTVNMTQMVQAQKDTNERLHKLEDRDAQKWQSTVKYIGTFAVGVLTAIVGAYLRVLLGI